MSAGGGWWHRRRGAPPLVFGHRGVRGPLAENTMAAFALAADAGADGIEFDVRTSADGVVVVCHDARLTRVTGGRDDRAVASLPYDELARVDVGGGEGVPRLDEVLRWAGGRGVFVNIEIKRDVPSRVRSVRATAEALSRAAPGTPRPMVSSFDPFILIALRSLVPAAVVGFLFHEGQRRYRPWAVARALAPHAAHPEKTLVSEAAVRRWRARARAVNVWTVNDPVEAEALAAFGVDGLITDAPGTIKERVG